MSSAAASKPHHSMRGWVSYLDAPSTEGAMAQTPALAQSLVAAEGFTPLRYEVVGLWWGG